MVRLEPSGTLVLTKEVRRLYDLSVFAAAGTLLITSFMSIFNFFNPIKWVNLTVNYSANCLLVGYRCLFVATYSSYKHYKSYN
ncbi:Uncharacterised protein [Yersinia enterocolitica]|nr:Uncharacterised protein [Yersinia enterocolitica]SUP64144.1 Uncharacterised protein [Yersinia enterocolitica]